MAAGSQSGDGVEMNNVKPNFSRLPLRLKWEWHRVAGALGVPGLSVCAVLLTAGATHYAILMPSINSQERELTRIASMRVVSTKEMERDRIALLKPVLQSSVGKQEILDLTRKYALS